MAEGRDIGTVVAPAAPVKVFLTASEQVRAERRAAELAGRQEGREAGSQPAGRQDARTVPRQRSSAPSAAVTQAEQAQRDRRDAPQSQMAADAIEIDATDLGLDDVIGRIVGLAAAKQASG